MYKEVVVSTSLKENTINIWDIHSCTNIFEFKENVSSKNGWFRCRNWFVGCALVNAVNRCDDYGLYPQSIYSVQVSLLCLKWCLDAKTLYQYLEVWESGSYFPKCSCWEGRRLMICCKSRWLVFVHLLITYTCLVVVLLENCIVSNSMLSYRYIWYLSSGDLLRVIDAHYKVLTIEFSD